MDITFDCYKKRNGEKYFVPKQVIKKTIDPYDSTTYLSHLEAMDYPYIISEWERIREYCIEKNMPEFIFPRYIMVMNLPAYRNFTWNDSEMFNNLEESVNESEKTLKELRKELLTIIDKYRQNKMVQNDLYRGMRLARQILEIEVREELAKRNTTIEEEAKKEGIIWDDN